jgi:hypothetical protein
MPRAAALRTQTATMKTKSEYGRKLADPRWQRKRLEIMSRDEFKCRVCLDDTQELQVHHKFYLPGKEPWEYDDDNLVTLCSTCHERITSLIKTVKWNITFEPFLDSLQNLNVIFNSGHWVPVCSVLRKMACEHETQNQSIGDQPCPSPK